jgi:protein-S-isoprenylcysteine O-methyltransferase Ste14
MVLLCVPEMFGYGLLDAFVSKMSLISIKMPVITNECKPLPSCNWPLIAFIPMLPLVILKILNEEEVLLKELPGYKEYCQKTR